MEKIIAHFDLDAFFASVEERENPALRGKPVVVGADPKGGAGRGVVSTANYLARDYGIHSALPISKAWQCSERARLAGKPPAVFVHGSFSRYGDASEKVMEVIGARVPHLVRASIDEAYGELSFTNSFLEAQELCAQIKHDVQKAEQLTVSVGVGPNKMLAKIASDVDKPNGLTVVEQGGAENFLANLSVRAIPGVGPKMEERLRRKNVSLVKDLWQFSEPELSEMFGKWGRALFKKSRGTYDTPLSERAAAKSIGEQRTFEEDSADVLFLVSRTEKMIDDVFARFSRKQFQAFRTIVLTVRFADFTTCTRSFTFAAPQKSRGAITCAALKLLLPFFDQRENPCRKKIRLLGVRIEKLT